MILEGFRDSLNSIGYNVESRRFKMQAFDVKNPMALSIGEVQLFRGCEFRTVYLKDILTNTLIFGIILDLRFKLEYNSRSCSYAELRRIITQSEGVERSRNLIREIRVKTGDLTPSGKVNAQASKFRYENILQIMRQIGEKIVLPDGNEAKISSQPTPIIIEV